MSKLFVNETFNTCCYTISRSGYSLSYSSYLDAMIKVTVPQRVPLNKCYKRIVAQEFTNLNSAYISVIYKSK